MSNTNTDAVKALGRRWQTDIWNAGSLSAALAAAEQIVAPDFTDHSRPPMLPDGLEGLKQQITIFYEAFPNIWSHVEDVLAEGDRVVVRWTGGGTHQGSFFGLPPTGRSGSTTGIHIFRVAGDRIVEHWGNSDDLGMMQKIGVIPSMG